MDQVQKHMAGMKCICRKKFRGEETCDFYEYSCMGIGTGMLKWQCWLQRYRGGVEFLLPSRSKEWLEYWDKRGYVHIVMQRGKTSSASYVIAIVRPESPSGSAGLWTHQQLVKTEYVTKVDYSRCNGCNDCVKRCQFAALRYKVAPAACPTIGVHSTPPRHLELAIHPRGNGRRMRHFQGLRHPNESVLNYEHSWAASPAEDAKTS